MGQGPDRDARSGPCCRTGAAGPAPLSADHPGQRQIRQPRHRHHPELHQQLSAFPVPSPGDTAADGLPRDCSAAAGRPGRTLKTDVTPCPESANSIPQGAAPFACP
jgi:hypothetical protein